MNTRENIAINNNEGVRFCCAEKCFQLCDIEVDGIACDKCKSYSQCRCKCKTYMKRYRFKNSIIGKICTANSFPLRLRINEV